MCWTGPGQDLATYTLATVTGHTDTLGQPGERNLEAETESEEEDVFTKLDVARSGERIKVIFHQDGNCEILFEFLLKSKLFIRI